MILLDYETDRFGGAIILSDKLPAVSEYSNLLKNTISELRNKGIKLLWIFLPLKRVDLVEISVNAGFSYHHADAQGLHLTLPLIPDAFIPGYATHYIGAGGVLLDDENRILVIQEMHHTRRHYKLPGGALDPHEHIADAVVREVREETGIESEFISLNCFRHWHGYRYGKSDIYFVCRLKPLSHEITLDPGEIAQALWMPVDDYLNDPDTRPFNIKIVKTVLSSRGLKAEEIEGYGSSETHEMMF